LGQRRTARPLLGPGALFGEGKLMSRVRWTLAGAISLFIFTTACPPPPPPIVMPADDLGDGTVGASYSHTLAATGGKGALGYAATGLPAGLSMDAGSGAISGAPAAAGD